MAKQETQKEKVKHKTFVPYHIELRTLIPSLGFKTSTDVFLYLRHCNVSFMYDRVYTTEDRILENIEEFNLLAKESYKAFGKVFGKGFIFVMDVLDTDRIDIVHLQNITKRKFVKYLRLKAFS